MALISLKIPYYGAFMPFGSCFLDCFTCVLFAFFEFFIYSLTDLYFLYVACLLVGCINNKRVGVEKKTDKNPHCSPAQRQT